MLEIVQTPHPILVAPAQPVKQIDKKLHEIIMNMKETLLATRDPKGVGLAAPQVGLSIRLFLAKPSEESEIQVFINPEIISAKDVPAGIKKRAKKRLLEGCLSIPNIWGNVTRKREVVLSYRDEKGKKHKKAFRGFIATIIQHETDHLNGILFTKHVMEQGEKLYRSFKNEKGQDEFEEIKI